jgi:hypothetical protein
MKNDVNVNAVLCQGKLSNTCAAVIEREKNLERKKLSGSRADAADTSCLSAIPFK